MNDTPVSDRQVRLLAVVAEDGGDWDARQIDLTADARYGPGEGTVLQELEALQRLGLVARDDNRSGADGRWTVTAAALPCIRRLLPPAGGAGGHVGCALPVPPGPAGRGTAAGCGAGPADVLLDRHVTRAEVPPGATRNRPDGEHAPRPALPG